ncbi:MAG: hypothetical protein IJU48_02445 [Synergistaceae bacterium]|nr:hypothetical protein [Synergistaceae bacterium]
MRHKFSFLGLISNLAESISVKRRKFFFVDICRAVVQKFAILWKKCKFCFIDLISNLADIVRVKGRKNFLAISNLAECVNMKRYKFSCLCLIMSILLLAGISEAVIKNGAIRGKNGLSYGSINYSFKSLNVTIHNSTKYNVNFGGTMLFLDKNYKVIARAELLKARIKRHSSRTYRAFFSEGSGNEAQSAKYLEWEF